ncbi:amino acid ABC transporter substrate-binding protein [Azospirillum sp. SYSU D00513]|uniref:amino acid ABC transporter substrate-binding protein n=1 Tax=Azospirillum sp. SYSU D00513 TaxID=2812561 RepID=UPI001A979B5B|nr:amino acid ABC transporter substrate-binding protein [Azospirillum sp. SYSU D00513]
MRSVGWLGAALLGLMLLGPAASPVSAAGGRPGAGGLAAGEAGDTLDRVRQAGLLRCGVITSGIGLSMLDEGGQWRGFYPDLCRAIAAAALGSADSVDFVEATPETRFTLVHDRSVDVVIQGTTWTLRRDAAMEVDFPVVHLFDGQGFLAHRSLGLQSLSDLKEGTVCVIEGTTTLRNLEDWIARTGSGLAVKAMRSTEGALNAFFNRHCDLFTNDRISLHALRLRAPASGEYVVLPDVISKEPLAPIIRAGDRRWHEIVRWVVLAMLLAEEKGITSASLPALRESGDPEVVRLFGLTPGIGAPFGLDDGWAARVILQVGNYGELFDRNLGGGSVLGIERGLNALWTHGGLHFVPPLGW